MSNLTIDFKGVKDWASFKSVLSRLENKQKGDAFEVLTKKYLQNEPVYASKLKNIWFLSEVPVDLRIHLNLPETDKGIDLIAETYEGEYWAIQCKYRENSKQNITWKELSTFTGLAFGICKNISFGLVCTSGDKYSNIFNDQNRIGICSNETWENLSEDYFELLSKRKSIISYKPYSPRPHQEQAINKAKQYFSNVENTRGKLIMPCGTGKSLTSFWISENLGAKKILIALPSLALLKQTLEVWLREYKAIGKYKNISWICVCSDSSINDDVKDDIISDSKDIGVPCTTNESQIIEWCKYKTKNTKIIFTTYQSSYVVASALKKLAINIDIGIFDEAHKTVGNNSRSYSNLLFDDNIIINKRIFMTATERRYKGISNQIISMDDTNLYGEVFYQLSYKTALESHPPILCDYKILTVYIKKQELIDLVEKNDYVKPVGSKNWDKEVEANMLLSLVAIKKAQMKYPIEHIISYHSSISRAKAFSLNMTIINNEFHNTKALKAYHVSGAMSSGVRQNIIKEFTGANNALVTNARCLTEGVDIPIVDAVVFADPKKNTIDIVQALGRALRPSPGKKMAYIILPIVINDKDILDKSWSGESYSDVLRILRALGSSDERIVEYFRKRAYKKSNKNFESRDIIEYFADDTFIDIQAFKDAVDIYCWDRISKIYFQSYRKANTYIKSLGLKDKNEWILYCKGMLHNITNKADNIPNNPEEFYSEWKGWDDWLGKSHKINNYVKYDIAKRYLTSVGIVRKEQWERYIKGDKLVINNRHIIRNSLIPARPDIIYHKEWKGWDDWLANYHNEQDYLDFAKAKEIVHTYGVFTREDWHRKIVNSSKLHKNIPPNPDEIYRPEWRGWDDWLRSENNTKFLSFEEARSFARKLELINEKEWHKYTKGLLNSGHIYSHIKIPDDIPLNPDRVYTIEWNGWKDWLRNSEHHRNNFEYLPFIAAKEFANSLGIISEDGWHKIYKTNDEKLLDIIHKLPYHPNIKYQMQWKGWDDFLSNKKYLNYDEARRQVTSFNIKNRQAWIRFLQDERFPLKVPRYPDIYYYKEWEGWNSWLAEEEYLEYDEAKKFVHGLNLPNKAAWKRYRSNCYDELPRLPRSIPYTPNLVYGKQWEGWDDWLFSSDKSKFLSFEDAKKKVSIMGVSDKKKWDLLVFKTISFPDENKWINGLPLHPNIYYESLWKGWDDWFGKS